MSIGWSPSSSQAGDGGDWAGARFNVEYVVYGALLIVAFGLLFMLVWIAPWVAIYITDYFMRRGRYDSRSLLDTGPGLYFRNGGVHVAGIVAQLVGMAAASWLDADPAWTSPLSNATGGADLSVFMGALFGAGIYYLLARRSVPPEAEAALMEPTLATSPPAG